MAQRVSFPRPALLTLAVAFATATILYSVVWMYAVRWRSDTQIGVTLGYSFATNSASVRFVAPVGPAAQAGLVAGDDLVAINGLPVETQVPYYDSLNRGQAGDVVAFDDRACRRGRSADTRRDTGGHGATTSPVDGTDPVG